MSLNLLQTSVPILGYLIRRHRRASRATLRQIRTLLDYGGQAWVRQPCFLTSKGSKLNDKPAAIDRAHEFLNHC